jgi:hypothetical protein
MRRSLEWKSAFSGDIAVRGASSSGAVDSSEVNATGDNVSTQYGLDSLAHLIGLAVDME